MHPEAKLILLVSYVAQVARAGKAAVTDNLTAAHGLAPWALHQQVGLLLFIFVLPKEPRQVQVQTPSLFFASNDAVIIANVNKLLLLIIF